MTDAAPSFADLDAYVALPRTGGLVLSPAGDRLVTAVSTLNPERNRYVTALWEVDPAGRRPARRLTRSTKGESSAAFLPDGGLLFTSARPDAEVEADDDAPAALWHLAAGAGEARVVATRPGGVGSPVVARDSGTVVLTSATMPSAVTADDDKERRGRRKERKVAAILHEGYPVRNWDHDLGPDRARLFAGDLPPEPVAGSDPTTGRIELRDLTPAPGAALDDEMSFDVTPDGATVVTTWVVPERGGVRATLVAIDTATGQRRTLLDDPEHEYGPVTVSPDGGRVAVSVWRRSTAQTPPDLWLAVLDLGTGELTDVARGWDRWPGRARWSPDGTALIVTADSDGSAPVFRVPLDGGEVVRLSTDRGAYSDVQVSPDGRWVYALRSAVDAPPTPVRLDALTPGDPVPLPGPAAGIAVPGILTEVTATALDGTPLRAWLALPPGAGAAEPAPLLVFIHGGPLGSWNAWSWRWNPWLAVARGYAVLLPDPALSTGYGLDFVARAWGRWGQETYTDLMAVTDAATARDDVDASRTAALGGSFGGYMANWIAGHTDRFQGIVTHASLWALDQFGPTTDAYHYWRREMTPAMEQANSPHRFVDAITTPMLVIHGDRDYRVPVGEALRLWAELAERFLGDDGTMPHKFLYFPDENHWILTPQHAKVWYETVFAFLATTLDGAPWQTPDILR